MINVNLGDSVIVTYEAYFYHSIRNGDIGRVVNVQPLWITLVFGSIIQNIPPYMLTEWTKKVDMVVREGYKDPEYIREIKGKLAALQFVHSTRKNWFKLRDKLKQYSGYENVSEKYLESRKELNYIYTILRQHNEMKKMYAKRKP